LNFSETADMQVIVQLRGDVAMELRDPPLSPNRLPAWKPETTHLFQAAAELGVRLMPVHPGRPHPALAVFFMIEIKDRDAGERIVRRLRPLEAVEAAYIRPDDETP
jgi:hypothetical protein